MVDCGSEPERCDVILIIMNNYMFIILTLFTVFDTSFTNCCFAIGEQISVLLIWYCVGMILKLGLTYTL